MSAPVLPVPGHSAFEAAALAAMRLNAALPTGKPALVEPRRQALIASLERLHQAGVASAWLTDWIANLSEETLLMVEFAAGVPGLLRLLGELLNVEEAIDAPRICDGLPAVLASGEPAPFEFVTWTCFGWYHSDCPGESATLGTCLCACHGSAPAPAPSRPASPPPSSGDGDDLAEEVAAARAATGDTLPPVSGEVALPEMACCGVDTDVSGLPDWADDQPMVRS